MIEMFKFIYLSFSIYTYVYGFQNYVVTTTLASPLYYYLFKFELDMSQTYHGCRHCEEP